MPSAKDLPCLMSLPASTMSCGVTWLSVPLMSSLPQRPQFESFCEASLMAAALTVMFIFSPCHPGRAKREPGSITTALTILLSLFLWVPGLRSVAGTTSNLEIHPVAALEHQDLARLVGRRDL